MSDTVIRVENLSKKYILSHQQEGKPRYKSLRDSIASGVRSLTHTFQNPKSKIQNSQEEFWALKDVSFEIKQGDRVGIIGRNGAGKSTLLKILSRITEPTKGRIRINGRVASLLEVGTGFHPELTGRENIYLNGAILGMSKAEIKRKFDEIVAFAEVEKFLDTPVKRYSSGMYVRLAFAVAAHLEPEVLIVDEVLAVGDAQFQQKCLGKMDEVAREGRTVLFVSHSMQAISQLTNRCVLLNKGAVEYDGSTDRAVSVYLSGNRANSEEPAYYQAPSKQHGNYIAWVRIHTSEEKGVHIWSKPMLFEFALRINEPQLGLCFSFQILNEQQSPICNPWIFDSEIPFGRQKGIYILRCEASKLRLFMGSYSLTTWLSDRESNSITENLLNICSFEISMHSVERKEYEWRRNECIYIEDTKWQVVQHSDFLLNA